MRLVVICRESTTEDYLAIELHTQCRHKAVRAIAKVNRRIDRAIRVQSRETIPRDAVEPSEISAHQQAAIDLLRESKNCVIGPFQSSPEEPCIERPICVQAGQVVAGY